MHNLKFKAIINLGKIEIEIEEISVCPDGSIGMTVEVLTSKMPKHYYVDFDDSYVCHFDEEKEIDEMVLSFLSGDDYIWLENSFTIIQIK